MLSTPSRQSSVLGDRVRDLDSSYGRAVAVWCGGGEYEVAAVLHSSTVDCSASVESVEVAAKFWRTTIIAREQKPMRLGRSAAGLLLLRFPTTASAKKRWMMFGLRCNALRP